MLRFKIERISQTQAIISLEALKTLIDAAKKVYEVEINEVRNDLPIEGLMMLEETSGAFDFLESVFDAARLQETDFVFRKEDEGFAETGLKVTSVFKMDKLATIAKR